MRHLAQRVLSHLLERDRQVPEIDNQVRELSRQSSVCRRLEPMPGIGPITATAVVATIGNRFANSRTADNWQRSLGWCPSNIPVAARSDCKGSAN